MLWLWIPIVLVVVARSCLLRYKIRLQAHALRKGARQGAAAAAAAEIVSWMEETIHQRFRIMRCVVLAQARGMLRDVVENKDLLGASMRFVACTSMDCLLGISLSSPEACDALVALMHMLLLGKKNDATATGAVRAHRMTVEGLLEREMRRYREDPSYRKALVVRGAVDKRLSAQELVDPILGLLGAIVLETALELSAVLRDLARQPWKRQLDRIRAEARAIFSSGELDGLFLPKFCPVLHTTCLGGPGRGRPYRQFVSMNMAAAVATLALNVDLATRVPRGVVVEASALGDVEYYHEEEGGGLWVYRGNVVDRDLVQRTLSASPGWRRYGLCGAGGVTPLSYRNLVQLNPGTGTCPVEVCAEWFRRGAQVAAAMRRVHDDARLVGFNSFYAQHLWPGATLPGRVERYATFGMSMGVGASCEFVYGGRVIVLRSGDVVAGDFGVHHAVTRVEADTPAGFPFQGRVGVQLRTVLQHVGV
jgi:hypothetical protein